MGGLFMPKMKTNRAAAKRFRRTKTGEFKRAHSFTGHLKGAKSSKRKRKLRLCVVLDVSDKVRMKRLLPYS
jgi:large subunit ribosomal protein L35